MKGIGEKEGRWLEKHRGVKADTAGFTEEVGRIWGGREKGRLRGTVMNMNKGLDAGMGCVSS